jgi:hypothetical protein
MESEGSLPCSQEPSTGRKERRKQTTKGNTIHRRKQQNDKTKEEITTKSKIL